MTGRLDYWKHPDSLRQNYLDQVQRVGNVQLLSSNGAPRQDVFHIVAPDGEARRYLVCFTGSESTSLHRFFQLNVRIRKALL